MSDPLPRPPIHQTYVPFVEMYINGVDILRSADGKPRTLLSFSHQRIEKGDGFWSLEVFDPSYVAIEELLLATGSAPGEAAEEAYPEGGGQTTSEIVHPAMFRYGYVSQDGKEIVRTPEGEGFFFGSIIDYTPTFQTNGTLFSITGQCLGFSHTQMRKIKRSFYGKNIYDIIKEVCEVMDWVFVPLGTTGDEEELSPEKQPEPLTVTSDSIDSTEEQPASFTMGENQSPYEFVKYLCNKSRPNDPQYNDYTCYLECRTEGKYDSGTAARPTKPTTYLYFGPRDAMLSPIRQYVFMRDPESDVISFTPDLKITVASVSGAAGMMFKGEDKLRGTVFMHPLDATNRDLKTYRKRRSPLLLTPPQIAEYQKGVPELGEETLKRPEGGVSDPQELAPPNAPDMDEPIVEMSSWVTDPMRADRETMGWWLAMQYYINNATLEIFGDPSPELMMEQNVMVIYYVPVEDDEFRIHWVTQMWNIVGIVHNITGGSYTTQLDLIKNSTPKGGVASRAAWKQFLEGLSPGAMRKLGG